MKKKDKFFWGLIFVFFLLFLILIFFLSSKESEKKYGLSNYEFYLQKVYDEYVSYFSKQNSHLQGYTSDGKFIVPTDSRRGDSNRYVSY